MTRFAALALMVLAGPLAGCFEETEGPQQDYIRALKTHVVRESDVSTLRRFPSVLEPASLSTLSFEIGGALQEFDLSIGQVVTEGEVLAQLDRAALDIDLRNAEAAEAQAQAEFDNAARVLKRQAQLFERGSVTQVAVERAQTDFLARQAGLDQAKQTVQAARTRLTKTTLYAPFSGIINSVGVSSFATVSAGTPIATLYASGDFETSFAVSFETAGAIIVGTPARVRLADLPATQIEAVITEVGQRADTVSAFPVVVTLREDNPLLKAGMAVEISLELPLSETSGVLLPMTAVSTDLSAVENPAENQAERFIVYVFDEATETVLGRQIEVSGVRGNSLIVTDGLSPGEHVASAGVSFLHDGQKVRLLDGPGQ